MTARLPTQLTTITGAPLPLPALPQDKLLTVNIADIPMVKEVFPGIHIQPLRIDPERGEWVFLATLKPGCSLPLHYHTGPAQVWTIRNGKAARIEIWPDPTAAFEAVGLRE